MTHWADQLADQIIDRVKREKRARATIRSGQTPSGSKHIGNLNDVLRAYYPYKATVEKGGKARFVHTADDRDPLKDVPNKLMDLDGRWHSLEEFPEVQKYMGMPMSRVPDPFGCCSSWSEHFTEVWARGIQDLGVHPELYSNDALYKEGKFEPYVKMVFEKIERASKIVTQFQRTKQPGYIPFDAICPNCGLLTNVQSFDLEHKTVGFVCGGKQIKKKLAEGCGFKSEAPWSEGKLQWRFEWPAQWAIFETTFEPFGKDHFEGSWKSGQVIAREVYGIEPPIPLVYEFFLVNGEKMSASKGNVFVVQDLMKIIEPEPFKYFYAKRPEAQRDLDLSKIFAMVDEFDAAERVYFGADEARTEQKEETTKRMYELVTEPLPKKQQQRVPYSFAASLIQLVEEDTAIKKLRQLGHLKNPSKEELDNARKRLRLAKHWIEHYATPEFKVALAPASTVQEQYVLLTDAERRVLHEFADFYEEHYGKEEAQMSAIKKLCAEHKLNLQDFFKAAYALLLGRPRGPKFVTLANVLDKHSVANRLRGSG